MKKLIFLSFLFFACNNTTTPPTALPGTSPEARLKTLGIQLPEVPQPVANYVSAVQTGNLIFLSGTGPRHSDGTYIVGKLGDDLTLGQGYAAARQTAINHLAILKATLGDLNRVKRVVKVLGMVNSTANFKEQPKVINGYSDLMVEVFGARGKHARSAVGMASLPIGIPVEVEAIIEIETP